MPTETVPDPPEGPKVVPDPVTVGSHRVVEGSVTLVVVELPQAGITRGESNAHASSSADDWRNGTPTGMHNGRQISAGMRRCRKA
jgi:hypothetical protein